MKAALLCKWFEEQELEAVTNRKSAIELKKDRVLASGLIQDTPLGNTTLTRRMEGKNEQISKCVSRI